MKFRPYVVAVAAFATAAFSLTVSAPAGAAATDPVTDLSVSQSQVGHELRVTATWTANPDATRYRTYLTDQADGNGAVLLFKDTASSSATLATTALAAGQEYWIAVKPIAPSTGDTLTTSFTANELDSTGPSGSYTLNRNSAYLEPDLEGDFEEFETASFTVTQTALSDDTTAAGAITRTIQAGDGSAPRIWTTGSTSLTYVKPGAFAPVVRLTDEFGNLTAVTLPTITVLRDRVAPKIRITIPANPGQVASWRHVTGTSTDVGTGVQITFAAVVQKRGRIWYAYDFHKKKWLKGSANKHKTIRMSQARAAQMTVNAAGSWRTPLVKGLRKGTLHIEAMAYDYAFNGREATAVERVLH